MNINEDSLRPLTELVIGAAIEVHRVVGPGLLEPVYQECLARELYLRGVLFRSEVYTPLQYKGAKLNCTYKMDFLIEEVLVLELKAVAKVDDVFRAQLLTYLRLSKLPLGLLINFHSVRLVDGVERIVNQLPGRSQMSRIEDIDLHA